MRKQVFASAKKNQQCTGTGRECRSRVSLRRRGSTFAAVLGTSLVVMTISAGALHAVRLQSQGGSSRDDIAEARLFAASAVEWGRRTIAADTAWRTTWSNGAWATDRTIGDTSVFPTSQGNFSLTVVNPSGALNRSALDSVVLTATGTSGVATQKAQVTLNAKKIPYTCLATAMSAAGTIGFNNSDVYGSGQKIASVGNSAANGNSADIYPNVESAGTVSGGHYHGSTQSGATARTFPSSSAFDYYTTNGTTISFTSIPLINGYRRISSKTLVWWWEPFTGKSNSQGIFIIDCGGNSLIIENSTILATLVLLNAGPDTRVYEDTNWWPAVSNYPCLMVQGNLYLDTDSYESGNQQGIYGLVYVSGNVNISNNPRIDNLVSGGSIDINSDLYLEYQSTFTTSPPPGFYTVDMVISSGSWKQVVD